MKGRSHVFLYGSDRLVFHLVFTTLGLKGSYILLTAIFLEEKVEPQAGHSSFLHDSRQAWSFIKKEELTVLGFNNLLFFHIGCQ